MSDYCRVYLCEKCQNIQLKYNDDICKKCGENHLKENVARWIRTTTFWEEITARRSGHWELKL